MATFFLVRHAKALSRVDWNKSDAERPLTERGIRQAQAIADKLKGEGVRAVRCSPAVRCRMTAEPIAKACGVPLETDAALFEGNDIELPDTKSPAVLVAHGDNIPALLARLGVACDRCETGSAWKLMFKADGTVKEATYFEQSE